MIINLLTTNPVVFLLVATAIVIAISIHEFAHAYIADKLGDPTPRSMDRVTLNPLAHLDPIGTIAILIAGIGWGKPVPFDPYNLENPRRDTLLIALAGPVSNFLLATLLSGALHFIPLPELLQVALVFIIQINIGLGVFNLVPIPPLDGSKIMASLLPPDKSIEYEEFGRRYGTFLLILFLMPLGGRSLVSLFIAPIIDAISNLLL